MAQQVKANKIGGLKELLKSAKCIVLNDFTGLNVKDISELRRLCRDNGVTYIVVKNTLAKKSFSEMGLGEIHSLLKGPTAIALSTDDEVAPAQVLKKFANDYELPRLKGGFVAGRVYGDSDMERLALLPGRDVLIAQAVGMFGAPMRGLVNCLGASLRNLVYVLKAVGEKKGVAS